jgi:hypothetical protein
MNASTDATLKANWMICKAWSEQSRYEKKTKQEAKDLVDAVNDPNHGALKWLMR